MKQVLAVGTDLVDVERMRQLLSRRPNIVNRLFLEAEREYAARQNDQAQRLAVRFAAKEAVMKALGSGYGELSFTEVEVIRSSSGQPQVKLHGKAAVRAAELGISRWKISLSHTHTSALAFVMAG